MPRKPLRKYLPAPLKRALFHIYSTTVPRTLSKMLGAIGYNVSRRADYYSPLPTVSQLKANIDRWNRPSDLSGVDYDTGEMKGLLSTLLSKYLEEFLELPPYAQLQDRGFGLGYTPLDALTLYLMIRSIKPKRYIEVGSGLSTYYCSIAAEKNEEEGFPIKITCIEPYPFEKLYSIPGIDIIAKEVQDIELSFFEQLEDGDVFFIDSSHSVRIDGDVPYLLLEILPKLVKGVFVHIHDIPFPYNIPFPADVWIFGKSEPVFWTEAMLLQALLSGNQGFKVRLSTPILRHFDEGFLQDNIPIYETVGQNWNAFSSIWIERT